MRQSALSMNVSKSIAAAILAIVLVAGLSTTVAACPFCTALKPTLSQRRDDADMVCVGELTGDAASASTANQQTWRIHQVLKGRERFEQLPAATNKTLQLPRDASLKAGALGLLFAEATATDGSDELTWSVVPVNETSLSYFARSPKLRTATAERLPYFIPYLEHADPLLAEDAYLEFGHAPYDQVAKIAERLPQESFRRWLTDPEVTAERKGFYGLALGLARDEEVRRTNAEFLRGLVLMPADDFRAGFDGVLGGYLMAAGEPGLALIEERLLANPTAREGDVRHAMTALRFYREYGREISAARLSRALRPLLARPEFAAMAIADLARWQDWDSLDQVAKLFGRDKYRDPSIEQAIVGYLLTCPRPQAVDELGRLRRLAPERVAEVEKSLPLLGGKS
jgi:hypothetical protein